MQYLSVCLSVQNVFILKNCPAYAVQGDVCLSVITECVYSDRAILPSLGKFKNTERHRDEI